MTKIRSVAMAANVSHIIVIIPTILTTTTETDLVQALPD